MNIHFGYKWKRKAKGSGKAARSMRVLIIFPGRDIYCMLLTVVPAVFCFADSLIIASLSFIGIFLPRKEPNLQDVVARNGGDGFGRGRPAIQVRAVVSGWRHRANSPRRPL